MAQPDTQSPDDKEAVSSTVNEIKFILRLLEKDGLIRHAVQPPGSPLLPEVGRIPASKDLRFGNDPQADIIGQGVYKAGRWVVVRGQALSSSSPLYRCSTVGSDDSHCRETQVPGRLSRAMGRFRHLPDLEELEANDEESTGEEQHTQSGSRCQR